MFTVPAYLTSFLFSRLFIMCETSSGLGMSLRKWMFFLSCRLPLCCWRHADIWKISFDLIFRRVHSSNGFLSPFWRYCRLWAVHSSIHLVTSLPIILHKNVRSCVGSQIKWTQYLILTEYFYENGRPSMYNHLWVYNCTLTNAINTPARRIQFIQCANTVFQTGRSAKGQQPSLAEAAPVGLILSVYTTASTLFSRASIPESQLASVSPLKAYCLPIRMFKMQTRPDAAGDVGQQGCSWWWEGGDARRTAVWKSVAASYEAKHPIADGQELHTSVLTGLVENISIILSRRTAGLRAQWV